MPEYERPDSGRDPALMERNELVDEIRKLRRRLAVAEQVCVLFGWAPGVAASDEGKATEQAWQDWEREYGQPGASQEWRALIQHLALRRDETRRQTLERLRGERQDRETGDA